MKSYIKKLIFPIALEITFVISCFVISSKYLIYTNFLFYLGIIIYFYALGDFKFLDLKENCKNGKQFFIPVLLTFLFLIFSFALIGFLSWILPNINDSMLIIKVNNFFELIIFAISTILFPSLAEELFFRKAIIKFDNKAILIITSIIGMFLYSIEHSLSWFGIIQTMIIATPLTISYIKTKNIYIPIIAHFFANLIANGISVIFIFLKLIK